ncbi:MAG TPA: hypothetical protein VNH83_13850 [Bryobacteraceae bacterium]|nr:hypothetical protein [Bryobacteraceae bacterium]
MSGITKTLRMTCVWAAAVATLTVGAAQDLAQKDPAEKDPAEKDLTEKAAAARAPASQDTVLHIVVVSGEDATHAPGERVAKPVTVQVTDGTGRPVEGARVSFQVPREGPGGVFSSGLATDLAVTDANGRATVRSLQLNRIAGRCLIRVTAAKEQARAGIVLQQYITERIAARESADRTAPLTAPQKVSPASSQAAPPNQSTATIPEAPSAVPLQPRKSKDSKALAAIIQPPKSMGQLADDTAPPRPPRVPTIVITQGSVKPVARAMVNGGYTTHQGKSHKKWIWLGILAAGGVGGAFAGSSVAAGHNSIASAPITIGTPTINIGKP